MKHIITYTIIFFLSITFFTAQGQNGFVSIGGNTIGANGSLSYSINQLVYTSVTSTNGTLTQGIQQPYEIDQGSLLGIYKYPDIQLDIKLYPNPTVTNVVLTVKNELEDHLRYQLFNLNGKLLLTEGINNQKTIIPLNNLPAAVYFLNIINNHIAIKTFKIIKTN